MQSGEAFLIFEMELTILNGDLKRCIWPPCLGGLEAGELRKEKSIGSSISDPKLKR
jgi:hypothetical protein